MTRVLVKRPRSVVPPEPERELLKKVIELARIHGWRAYHTFDARHSEAGFPDCVLVKPGFPVIFAELKSATGKLSDAQLDWLADLGNVKGVRVCVWRVGDTQHIAEVLAGNA